MSIWDISAQTLNFHNYSTEDGLPQSTVYDIVQDSSGFIWFGTEAGLGKFDGINIETFSLSDGIIGNNIEVLFIDKLGSLWIGTTDGLSILFENEVINYTVNNGLPDNFVHGITEDNQGNIWIATRYGGICRFNGNKITVFNKESGIDSDEFSGVFKDSKGNLWFSSYDSGIIKYNGSEFINYSETDGLLSNSVSTVFEDSDELIWIGTDRGVTTFNGKTFLQFSEKEGFPQDMVSVIVEDSYGDIWIGMQRNGVIRFDGRKVYKHYGLESKEIRSALLDKRGDLWFGTFLGGLSRLPVDWFEIYLSGNGITYKDVYSITQADNGTMYFGHFGKGISTLEDGKFRRPSISSNLISNNVSSILYDNNKNFWFGTIKGVTKFNSTGQRSFTKRSGLALDYVLKIFEDKKGFIWFGATGGVSRFDPSKNVIVDEFKSDAGFSENAWVNDIYQDDNGILWFATHSSGLLRFDGKSFSKIDTSNGLPINNIFSVTQDKYGYLWLATDGKGICRYDGEKFINITENDGLTSDVSYFILEKGRELFVGTLNGISILENNFSENKSKNYKFRYISKNEGIPSGELNQGAYFEDDNGLLWFGTNNGLIKIDPNKKINEEVLPTFISEISITDGVDESKFKNNLIEDLDYEQNTVTINFHTVSFAKPNDTKFEFKLEGLEDNWSTTSITNVTYRALPSGTYKFWIKAYNNSNVISEPKLLVSFTISAPFYKTWWFISSTTLIVGFFIYGLYFYKTQQVKKRNAALESMVRDRTSELEKEKNKSDELLHNILPSSLVDELKIYGKVRPRRFNSVSIMFTDFKSFTYTTSVLPPEELVNELNDIFKKFDSLIGKYGLEKLKTIGDSYMAACGIPSEIEDHAIRTVYCALDFQKMIKERNQSSPIKWEMRLGIHSGSVVAGVVGTKKFTYDIWGDTVNIASRMESSGEPGEINISGYTYMLVRDHFECEYRGKVETKGKGSIDMYFVHGINNDDITKKKYNFKPLQSFKQIS